MVLSVYSTWAKDDVAVVAVNLRDDLPRGAVWLGSTSSSGGTELSGAGVERLAGDDQAYACGGAGEADRGEGGEAGLLRHAGPPDEKVQRRDVSVVVRVARPARVYLPLLQRP